MNDTKNSELPVRDRIKFAIKRYQGITIETDLSDYLRTVARIREIDYGRLSDPELRARAEGLKGKLTEGSHPELLLPETYAAVQEAARRRLGFEAFDEQLVAGIVLEQGKLGQMRTGEGKTLAAVFAACPDGFVGGGVHILTANEYLARRDAEWMGGIYELIGLSIASVDSRMTAEERRKAYRADVTYLTAKQAGFDYLEDELRYDRDSRVQRPFESCIVDEADFLLIDEARITSSTVTSTTSLRSRRSSSWMSSPDASRTSVAGPMASRRR